MERKIKLKKIIRFRIEKGYILLFHGLRFKDYHIPLTYKEDLFKLQNGCYKKEIKNKRLIRDLEKINALSLIKPTRTTN